MSCSNCFNGCSQITSDQCVRYTGVDVPILGIQQGDSLSYIQQALIEFLVSTLDGSGIKVDIDPNILCPVVSNNLPTCGDITIVDVMNALIKTTCFIQTEIVAIQADITNIEADITEINGPYTLPSGCLGTLPANPTTHDVVQAVVTTLCAFIVDVQTNYVLLADLDTLIAQYLASQGTGNKVYEKMIPYVAYEYYGDPIGKFDGTGAGFGDWEKVYLCNGDNGTPDKRGRVAVGATSGMNGTVAMDAAVNPGGLNPAYSVLTKVGSNGVTLNTQQMPSHTHTPTINLKDPGHGHDVAASGSNLDSNIGLKRNGATDGFLPGPTPYIKTNVTGITVDSAINSSEGGGQAHPNNQPAIGCYYIMYRP